VSANWLNLSAANSEVNSLSDRFEMLAEIDCSHFTGTIQISLTSRGHQLNLSTGDCVRGVTRVIDDAQSQISGGERRASVGLLTFRRERNLFDGEIDSEVAVRPNLIRGRLVAVVSL
jgi:hypothetical protein